jgi:ribosome maturation factor RimP
MGWAQPIFFCSCRWRPPPAETAPEDLDLNALLERTLPALGYELVDLELSPKGRLVRIFIDKAAGVDVEDCARVSSHLTRLFAVENVDFDRLEVSSPGLDRPLKKAADYARFVGQEAKLTLREPVEGARRLKGILRGLEGDAALVETDAGTRAIPLGSIEKARLVPKIEWR